MSQLPTLLVDNLPERQRNSLLGLDQLELLAKNTLRRKLGVIESEEIRDRAKTIRDSIEVGRRAVMMEQWRDFAYVTRAVRIELARVDSGIFTEHVMRTERGNQPIRLTGMHREWHDMADLHRFLVLWAHIESGKTSMFLVGRLLWRLGRNPTTRAIIVSENSDKAKKVLSQGIAKYILQSEELHEVFPDLIRNPDPTTPWNKSAITVKREGVIRDPSVQSVGAMRGSVQGARADFLALDDVVTRRTSNTVDARRELSGWVNEDLLGRVDPLRGEIIVTNTARCKDDLTNEMAAKARATDESGKPRGFANRYGVFDKDGKARCPWWSRQKVDEHFLSAVEKQRQLFCEDREDEDSPFQGKWAEDALKQGEHYGMVYYLTDEEREEYLKHGMIACGVDLAAKKKRPGAKTVFTVLYVTWDGTHQILWSDNGNWTSPDIRDRLIQIHERYRCPIFVETNGVQSYLKEIVEEKAKEKGIDLRIEAFITGMNKHDPVFGVESIFVQMNQGRWIIPSQNGAPLGGCRLLIEDMESYRPNAHTGDSLMSCVAPGAMVTTQRGLVPVEEIVTGDMVLSHRSRWQKVTGTTKRDYDGPAIRMKARGLLPVVLTDEHPIWTAPARHKHEDKSNNIVPGKWEWDYAKNLRVGSLTNGDFVMSPVAPFPTCSTRIDMADYLVERVQPWGGRWHVLDNQIQWRQEKTYDRWLDVDEEFAWVLGLYLAEGNVGGKPSKPHQTSFSLHEREKYLADVAIRQMQQKFNAHEIFAKSKTKCMRLSFTSSHAARFFAQLGKKEHKCLPWSWMGWPLHLRLQIVRGWLCGDGRIHRKKAGKVAINGFSISRNLTEQMRLTLVEAGMLPSVHHTVKKGPMKLFGDKISMIKDGYQLSLTATDTSKLFANQTEAEHKRFGDLSGQEKRRTNTAATFADGGFATKLSYVERVHYKGPVYNMHVEEDESFTVEGIAVHNCFICKEGIRLAMKRKQARNVKFSVGAT